MGIVEVNRKYSRESHLERNLKALGNESKLGFYYNVKYNNIL